MSKVNEIIEGYSNLLNKNQEVEIIAKQRQEICDGCDQNSKNHNVIKAPIDYCINCGCILKAKVRSVEAKCPLGKW